MLKLADREVTVAVVFCPVQCLVCDVSEPCLYKNSDLLVAVRFRFTLYAPLVPDQEQPTPASSREQFCQTRLKWMIVVMVTGEGSSDFFSRMRKKFSFHNFHFSTD